MLLGNSRFGERYIFGGDRTTAAPFVEQADGILYIGDADPILEEIASGQCVRVNVDGLSALASPAPAIHGSAISASAMTADTTLAWLGITPGSIRVVNGSETTIIDLSSASTIGDVIETINESGARVTAEIDAAGTGLVITNLLAGANLAISDITPGTGATDLGIAGSSGPSGVLGMLLELRGALEADSTSRIQSAQSGIEDSVNGLMNSRATVGAKMSRFEMASGRLVDEMIRVTELLSNSEDADLAQLATEYAMQQTAYETALAVTANVLQPSLLEFLR